MSRNISSGIVLEAVIVKVENNVDVKVRVKKSMQGSLYYTKNKKKKKRI